MSSLISNLNQSLKLMKTIKYALLAVTFALCLSSEVAYSSFTINPTTYNPTDTTKGVIWFDTVGTMSYDVNGNPKNVVGSLGNSTIKVDFLFTSGAFTAVSQVYSLDAAANGFLAFGTVSGRAAETVSSADITPGLTGTYQVRAWLGGSSFTDPLNTKKGTSSGLNALTFGGTPAVGNPVTPSDLTGFASFAIVTVPEPATLALGLFGAVGMLIRRRK